MSVIRTFIAVSLSEEAHRSLNDVISELRLRLPVGAVRWSQAKNIHLTLKFLGNVSTSNIDLLKNILASEIDHHAAFTLSIGGIGAFPNLHKPRIIWVGIRAPAELFLLQKGIEVQMQRLGYPPEEKHFSPHLTLARLSRNGSPADSQEISRVLGNYKVDDLGSVDVRTVDLYQSDLQPGGPIYTKLASFGLKAIIN